jgi:hypothetical protein
MSATPPRIVTLDEFRAHELTRTAEDEREGASAAKEERVQAAEKEQVRASLAPVAP